jgi:acyl-CoA synthetase (AMP-forming)/AMP-acid ligase II
VPAADGEGMELTSCGRPFPAVTVRIVDYLDGVALPDGEIGEIWVASPTMSTGYFRQPLVTEATFGQELPNDTRSYLRTGDLAAMIDGELFVTGRLKDLIIIRGRNIYPQDVEAATLTVWPGIGLSTAFELAQHPSPVGLLVEVDLQALSEDGRTPEALARELRATLVERFSLPGLAIGMVPVGSLPRTPTGKVQRRPTRARLEAGGFSLLYSAGFAPSLVDSP